MLILIKRKSFNFLLRILQKIKIQFIRNIYWNLRVNDIHNMWGSSTEDYSVLKEVIELTKPEKLLDIGCGSGRCFALYESLNVKEVTAQDIASEALKLCNKRYPDIDYKYELKDIDKLCYPENYFDLIISNTGFPCDC